jgi:hypothetical protein
VALLLAGVLLLSLDSGVFSSAGAVVTPVQSLAIGCLASGVIAVCIGVLASFSMMPFDVAHAKLGLCTGLLDEQHPWLYKAFLVMRDKAADGYRQRILSERGPLRGIDYIMMREIAMANDALEMTRIAHSVSLQLNQGEGATPDELSKEPRLVSVPSSSRPMASPRAGSANARTRASTSPISDAGPAPTSAAMLALAQLPNDAPS